MANDTTESKANIVIIRGRIEDDFEVSHDSFGKRFYKTRVIVKRLSGVEDLIPITIDSSKIKEKTFDRSIKGKYVEVSGQLRGYNIPDRNGKYHLILNLVVHSIEIFKDKNDIKGNLYENFVYLEGYICKAPIYRITPQGRKITDLLLLLKRYGEKVDNIRCIAWGNNAIMASELQEGTKLKIWGRLQSRTYIKRFSQDSEDGVTKITYEVSIDELQVIDDNNIED